MPERRSAHQTQWAAQFAVASELCKRGYQVALTMGNHPMVDLMVISPNKTQFSVDVKGLYKKNYWAVREKEERGKLFYIFAYVPENAQNEFYVADQRTANTLIRTHLEQTREKRLAKGSSIEKLESFPGIPWDTLQNYKNKWDSLPP